MKKNHQLQEQTLSSAQWQHAVNDASAEILIALALEAGFISGPRIDPVAPWHTLMLGLERSVHPQKDKVIEMIAEAIEPGDPSLARRFAARMWEEFAARSLPTGH